MHKQIQIIAIIMTIIFTGIIFELVRKKRLREEYSLVWLLAGVCMLLLSLNRGWVEGISRFMGVSYAPSALFIVAFFFAMLLAINFSLIVSHLTERVRVLVQQNALLKQELDQLASKLEIQRPNEDTAQ